MSAPRRFRKKPIEVEAIRWKGDNANEVLDFAGDAYFDVTAEDGAAVWDKLHGVWVPFQTGDWVVRGVQGELYPVKADVFEATYEAAEGGGDE